MVGRKMNIAPIDNSFDGSKVILWQYDRAHNLISLFERLDKWIDVTTSAFWDNMINSVNPDTADSFGLSLLGILIGTPRPDMDSLPPGVSIDDVDNVFRRLLKAKMVIYGSCFSTHDINKYLSIVFGKGKCYVKDYGAVMTNGKISDKMHIEYKIANSSSWSQAELLFSPTGQYAELVYVYPAGVRRNTAITASGLLSLNIADTEGQNGPNFAMSPRQNSGGSYNP